MHPTRRHVLQGLAATTATAVLPLGSSGQDTLPARKTIASTGLAIPVVGLGTWITFNVGDDPVLRAECAEVMAAFFAAGGRVIDSSPMYGSSQDVIGYGLERTGTPEDLFAADKVWTSSPGEGRAQMEMSRKLWGIERFDLMQVHNLVAWRAHLETLFEMKAAGDIRYVGITTSENRRLEQFEEIMASQPLDFVQVTCGDHAMVAAISVQGLCQAVTSKASGLGSVSSFRATNTLTGSPIGFKSISVRWPPNCMIRSSRPDSGAPIHRSARR